MLAGLAAWCGAVVGRALAVPGMLLTVVAALAVSIITRHLRAGRTVGVIAAVMTAAALSGWLSAERDQATLKAAVGEGPVTLHGEAKSDERDGSFLFAPSHTSADGEWAGWHGPRLLVELAKPADVVAGTAVTVTGRLRTRPMTIRGDPVAGVSTAATVESGGDTNLLFATGNRLRSRVLGSLQVVEDRRAAGLLAGFLVGDTRDLPPSDVEALRLAGLSHFVAVSGSNVALFLGAWWLAAGPLAIGLRRRALVGLVGLAVFVIVTRWEPSVVRAATMAGLVLAGRLAGVPLDGWTALGGAVAILLLASAELATDVGFQLSVAATAGVMAAAPVSVQRGVVGWIAAGLRATAGAQVAVAPLLLLHFGTIPLLAPLTNLVAAPLVAAATALGGVGTISGLRPLTAAGLALGRMVLGLAGAAEAWPQLTMVPSLVAAALAGGLLVSRLRPASVLAGSVWIVVVIGAGPSLPLVATATFLDVGQGDAALLRDEHGSVVLIDGGRDPRRLGAALRRYGVTSIDLLIATHGDDDHVGGLEMLPGRVVVRSVWHPDHPDQPPSLRELVQQLTQQGASVQVPAPGWRAKIGSIVVTAVGPQRRYASENDGSLVVEVDGGGVTVLFTGDIEAVAQRDLAPPTSTILKVPHHGAGTSDLRWLRSGTSDVAVISVGPNNFGHPSPEVVAALEESGARVLRTDVAGDISIPLTSLP